MRVVRIALLIAALWGSDAIAQPTIPGQDDPAFVVARDAWLAGDDLAALTALSALANDDNAAAQILLGRIASDSYFHEHVTGDLERADRIALLRRQGGLSGKSWLTAAAETIPLAQAFLDADRAELQADAALILAQAGELRAALTVAMNRINYGDIETAMSILPPDGDGPLTAVPRYFIRQFMLDGTIVSELLQGQVTTAQQMAWLMPPIAAFANGGSDFNTYVAASDDVPTLNAHRQLCTIHCPATQAACTVVLGSASLAHVSFSSPSEVLIDQDRYDASPRVLADIRRLADNDFTHKADVATLDQCAADLLFPAE